MSSQGLPPPPAGRGGSERGPVERFFDRLMELNPVEATYHGLHERDHLLPDGASAAAEERRRLLEALARELEAESRPDLDLEVARFYVELALFDHREVRLWERMADGPDLIGTAIFLLFSRDFAPLEERLAPIADRLEAVPGYLAASRERLTRPVRLWNAIAAETARRLPALFATVAGAAQGSALQRRLESAASAASAAADDFATWLQREVVPSSADDWALGEERFAELIRLRRLPDPPPAILRLGRRYLAETKEERADLVARHWPGRSLDQVNEEVRSQQAPSFEAALGQYRDVIERARRFLEERRLVTLPSGEELRVEETPSFLRPVIPFAAYEPPAFFDEPQLGIYIVTRRERELGHLNWPSILNTSVHEGYPGHHLQFACANRNRSLARLLAAEYAVELVEGWAHYSEQLMFEEGFGSGPEVRFVQLNDQIWRACRVIIDVELSSGRMSFDEAVRMLLEEAALGRAAAEAEVRRYTYTPGYQLSYLYGKQLLLQLRRRRREREGSAFDLGRFHDTLLSQATLPAAMWDRAFA